MTSGRIVTRALRRGVVLIAASVASATAATGAPLQPDIVNGALSTAWPGIGAVVIGGSGLCTGHLIAPQWVLTAAHCISGLSGFAFTSAADITDPGAVFYSADSSFVDPAYNQNDLTSGHDVALLHFAAPIPAMPLRLNANAGLVNVGTDVTMVGYGLTSSNGNTFGVKREGHASLSVIFAHMLEIDSGTSSACSGDSGGPWYVSGTDGFPVVVGSLSFGSQDCTTLSIADPLPDVLTFIQSQVTGLCLSNTVGAPCDGVFRNGLESSP